MLRLPDEEVRRIEAYFAPPPLEVRAATSEAVDARKASDAAFAQAIETAMRNRQLVEDRFVQRIDRPYGQLHRAALLVRVSPETRTQLIARAAEIHFAAGATEVVPAEIEAAVEIAARVLRRHGVDREALKERLSEQGEQGQEKLAAATVSKATVSGSTDASDTSTVRRRLVIVWGKRRSGASSSGISPPAPGRSIAIPMARWRSTCTETMGSCM